MKYVNSVYFGRMNLILFDDDNRNHLLPLTFTRPVAELRVGILTIREKWERHLGLNASWHTQNYLRKKFPLNLNEYNWLIAGSLLPDDSLLSAISALKKGEALCFRGSMLAAYNADGSGSLSPDDYSCVEYTKPFHRMNRLWDIFSLNGLALEADFDELTKGRVSQIPDNSNKIMGTRFFMEEGAQLSCSIINTTSGAVYLAKDSEIWEGCMIRGGFALCQGSSLKMGAKIYGPTTVGPGSRVGGEVSNCVFQGYSNKGHDGFLGNSVLGEWCNLGADTNCSNLKNNYSTVELYDYAERKPVSTGLQFCGLIMGDHSKCGINTMFNTGTVVGVSANIFGAGFPPKWIPSFAWGGTDKQIYQIEKALETAERVFQRRNVPFTETEKDILRYLHHELIQQNK